MTRLWEVTRELVDAEWWEDDAAVHDLALYGVDLGLDREAMLQQVRSGFKAHPFVAALLASVDERGMRFGAIKAWIQSNCEDVPAPRRRELTDTVQTLLEWINQLLPEDFELLRPRHSQLLRRRS